MTSKSAAFTASNRETSGLAGVRLAPPTLKHDAPWRRVLLRHIQRRQGQHLCDLSLSEIYRRMGFKYEQEAYAMRTTKRITLVRAAQLAQALELSDRAAADFLLELAREEGVPPIGEKALLRPSISHAARMGSSAARPRRASSSRPAPRAPRRKTVASSMLEVRSSLRPLPRRPRPRMSGRDR